jgi:hypothetical protein
MDYLIGAAEDGWFHPVLMSAVHIYLPANPAFFHSGTVQEKLLLLNIVFICSAIRKGLTLICIYANRGVL